MIRNLNCYYCKNDYARRDHFLRNITVMYDTGERETHTINMYCPTNECLNNALYYWTGAFARGREGEIEAAQICHAPRKMTDTFYMLQDGTIKRACWRAYRSEIFFLSDAFDFDFWENKEEESFIVKCCAEDAIEVYGDFMQRVGGFISRYNDNSFRLSF